MMNLATLMAETGAEVHQLCIRPRQQLLPDRCPELPAGITSTHVPVDTMPTKFGALKSLLLSSEPYHVARHESAAYYKALSGLLLNVPYDVIQFESVYLLQYLTLVRSLRPTVPVVLRAQNVEHHIWQGLARNSSWPIGKYLVSQARRIERYEERYGRMVDHILTLTKTDEAWFRQKVGGVPVETVPVGLVQGHCPTTTHHRGSFFHLAAMNWLPNEEGVRWFLREVWPLFVRYEVPAELHLAGTGMPEDILAIHHPHLFVSGHVDDPVRYMCDRGIMVVPLLSGSGIRVKILEGMQLGKVIISTSIGVKGIACTDGHDILIADTPADMARQMKRCMDEPDLVRTIGRNAHALASSAYAAATVSAKLAAFYDATVGHRFIASTGGCAPPG